MSEIIQYSDLIKDIKNVLISAREYAAQTVNSEVIQIYWSIGKLIWSHYCELLSVLGVDKRNLKKMYKYELVCQRVQETRMQSFLFYP